MEGSIRRTGWIDEVVCIHEVEGVFEDAVVNGVAIYHT